MIKEDGSVQVHDDPDQKITLWYIMDEFGSRFYHSDEPNMAFKLFFHVPTQMSFTLIYPIKDIEFEGKLAMLVRVVCIQESKMTHTNCQVT